MTLMNKLLSGSAALALVGLLACGGGGSTPPPPSAVAPSISAQPVAQTVSAGATATFTVTATGSAPLSYQWKKGGAAISGATSTTYTTPATTMADTGSSFTVTVSNSAGTATSSAAVLTVQPNPPGISVQPTNQTVMGGWAATFTVTATGIAPLSYQWNKGGTAIPGATSASYITPPTVAADSGSSFTVTVSNSGGSTTSSSAVLTIQSRAPGISVQPINQTVVMGATVTFAVTAAGTGPLSYQWNKGGTAITGATFTTYTTPPATLGDSGSSFTVTVSNSAGSITSSPAVLTVQSLATNLAYTDPTTGTYLLTKNTALSTATHLVLDLVGPAAAAATGSGVTATFNADTTKVTWVNVAAGDPANTFVLNGTAFTLGATPQILKGKVAGDVLQATAAQKGPSSPVPLNVPLLRIAIDLKAAQPVGTVTFTADAAKCQVLDGAGAISGITVSVGTLTAQ